eukprot:GFUD01041081.1.p1 GENE.GFUD01041081.1~~GFUD01041081.1.p1  ORF type:complete len:143 (-),score=34.14 GFUD01041081.1:51-479(-)
MNIAVFVQILQYLYNNLEHYLGPQTPGGLDDLPEIAFYGEEEGGEEEKEDNIFEEDKPLTFLDTNYCDNIIVLTSVENIHNLDCDSFHQNPQTYQNCHCYKLSDYGAECQNQEVISQRSFDDEMASLDASLQQIFGCNKSLL